MTAIDATDIPLERPGFVRRFASGLFKFGVGIVLCMTPITALVALGWLTRKTASDIEARLDGRKPGRWPRFIKAENGSGVGFLKHWTSGLFANLFAGIRAWAGILALTLPFSLIWFAGWFAGWENSFSKGYEQAFFWPSTSLIAVLASVPVLALSPMAIAHQASRGTVTSIFHWRHIVLLIRSAGWSYVGLTLLIVIGWIGAFGVRALPTMAEQFSQRVASGSAEAIAEFALHFKVGLTVLLFTGLLVIRHAMARVYARAVTSQADGKIAGWLKSSLMAALILPIWLGLVFLIYLAQFLNYSWWSWLNQPVLMLPWLGILR